jgi:hypothetical protein
MVTKTTPRKVHLYVEGGNPKTTGDLTTQAREAFRTLLSTEGVQVVVKAHGGRGDTFKAFRLARRLKRHPPEEPVLLLIDAEAPVSDVHRPWEHLKQRDNWDADGVPDADVLLMVQVMETWMLADPNALRAVFPHKLDDSKLPAPGLGLEGLTNAQVYRALAQATQECSRPDGKGDHSFRVVQRLNPATLRARLPSFKRAWERIHG